MEARIQLHHMRQDRDELIRSFGAFLRGQAGVCKFFVMCPGCNSEVNYTENVLGDVLIRGLADNEIQLDLLGDKNQEMSLEELFQFIEAKEAGKRSAGHLQHLQGIDATRSQCRRTKQDEAKARSKADPCNYCGKLGHGKNAPSKARKTECPAYGTTCAHCGRANHFEAVCHSKGREKTQHDDPSNSAAIAIEGCCLRCPLCSY